MLKKISGMEVIQSFKAIESRISFDYTLGNTEGDYIFDGIEVDLTESDVGVIQVHGIVPFYLEVTEEQLELLSTLDQDNSVMEFDKFKFESAK